MRASDSRQLRLAQTALKLLGKKNVAQKIAQKLRCFCVCICLLLL